MMSSSRSKQGLVTVIIPVHNSPDGLSQAVDSCLRQTCPRLEVVIVDDGSTDSTSTVADRLHGRLGERCRVVHQRRAGPGAARQAGLQGARGEWIQWLDADDTLEPDKIRPQVDYLTRHRETDIVFCDWIDRVTDAPPDCRDVRRSFAGEVFLEYLLGGGWVALHSYLMRRSALDRVRWRADLPVLEDWQYILDLALSGSRFQYLHQSDQAVYHRTPDDPHRNQVNRQWLETRLAIQELMAGRLSGQEADRLALAWWGLAWRCVRAGHIDLFEASLSRAAGTLRDNPDIHRELRPAPFPLISPARSLRIRNRIESIREWCRNLLLRRLGLNRSTGVRKGLVVRSRHWVQTLTTGRASPLSGSGGGV